VLVAAVIMQGMMNLTMLRDPLDKRLADVLAPASVLVAVCLVRAGSMRGLARAGLLLLLLATVGSAAITGSVPATLRATGLTQGVDGVVQRAREIDSTFAPPRHRGGRESDGSLVRYLGTCTPSGSRLLTLAFAPELFFYTGRGFAAGHVMLMSGYFVTDRDEAFMLSRLAREDVPFVIVDAEIERELPVSYPRVVEFVSGRYHEVVREGKFVVLAETARQPVSRYGDGRLPCFSAQETIQPTL
jgi:hypothetical protein